MKNNSIIIAAGPSIKKFNHLKMLAESDYKGIIICTDIMAEPAIKAGITPDKFPDFYIVSTEFGRHLHPFYFNESVKKYAQKIKVYFFTEAPEFVQRLRNMGLNVLEYPNTPDLDIIVNVGMMSWFLAWKYLSSKEVVLIGMNQGHDEDYIKRYPEWMHAFFIKGFNETLKCDYWLDAIYQYYQKTFYEYLDMFIPNDVITINCSKESSLEHEKIKYMEFEDYLNGFRPQPKEVYLQV